MKTIKELRENLKSDFDYARLEAYRALGFTKEAFKDESWFVRLEAYIAIGFPKEALKDDSWVTREEAEQYWFIRNEDGSLKDENDDKLNEIFLLLNKIQEKLNEIHTTN